MDLHPAENRGYRELYLTGRLAIKRLEPPRDRPSTERPPGSRSQKALGVDRADCSTSSGR